MNNADKPAYPNSIAEDSNGDTFALENGMLDGGLTKRERFAMAAMQGLLSNPETMKEMAKKEQQIDVKAEQIAAVWSIEQADALLKQLEE